MLLLLCALFGAAALPLRSQQAAPKDPKEVVAPAPSSSLKTGSWWDGDTATGDWGGARDRLHDKGFDFFADYTAIGAGNPAGGKRHESAYAEDFSLGLKVDLGKLAGWEGLTFTLSGLSRDGADITPGIGSQYSAMQLVGGQNLFLYNLNLEQKFFRDRLALKVGRIGAGDDFATSPLYGYYLSNGINGYIRAVQFDTGFSAYPFSVWGARLRADPSPEFNFQSGIYQVSGGMSDSSRNGLDLSVHSRDGSIWLNQAGWTPEFFRKPVTDPAHPGKTVMKGMPGHYFAGGWWSSWDYPRFGGGGAGTLSDSYGAYVHADQMVYQAKLGGDQGLVLFATLSYAPQPSIAIVPFQASGGALYRGLLPGRPDDMAIFGAIHGDFSDDYARTVAVRGAGSPDAENVFEWGYRIQLNRWFYLQPDLQWVNRPGGTGRTPDALVLGTQFGVKF